MTLDSIFKSPNPSVFACICVWLLSGMSPTMERDMFHIGCCQGNQWRMQHTLKFPVDVTMLPVSHYIIRVAGVCLSWDKSLTYFCHITRINIKRSELLLKSVETILWIEAICDDLCIRRWEIFLCAVWHPKIALTLTLICHLPLASSCAEMSFSSSQEKSGWKTTSSCLEWDLKVKVFFLRHHQISPNITQNMALCQRGQDLRGWSAAICYWP